MLKASAMRARMRGLLPVTAIAAVAAIATTTGCGGGPEAPHGSPVLLQAFWQSPGARTLFWSLEPDASVAPAVPAAATEIDFVFDRRMDGYRIESSDSGVPVSKADPPITVDWADAATVMSAPPLTASVFYNSIGAFGRDTSYVFVRPQPVGFPSGTALRFALDANGLTSAYGEPMIGPAEISVTTEPLSIVSSPTGGQIVPTGFLAPVKFSTRIDAAQRVAVLMPFVHVTAAGTPVAFTL